MSNTEYSESQFMRKSFKKSPNFTHFCSLFTPFNPFFSVELINLIKSKLFSSQTFYNASLMFLFQNRTYKYTIVTLHTKQEAQWA